MYNSVVVVRPDHPNYPLAELWVGQGGNGLVLLRAIPREANLVRFILKPVGSQGSQAYYGVYDTTWKQWVVTLPAWAFPTVGQAEYEITFTTGEETEIGTFPCGTGFLNVYASAMSAEIPDAPEVSTDLVITDPVTGKRYQLIAVTNDLNQPAPALIEKV